MLSQGRLGRMVGAAVAVDGEFLWYSTPRVSKLEWAWAGGLQGALCQDDSSGMAGASVGMG